MEWLAYTRKDFQFPHVQMFPHRDPAEEVRAARRGQAPRVGGRAPLPTRLPLHEVHGPQ
jgi:hypothetical protein